MCSFTFLHSKLRDTLEPQSKHMTQFKRKWKWPKPQSAKSHYTNCRFSVIRARTQTIPGMLLQWEKPAPYQVVHTFPIREIVRSVLSILALARRLDRHHYGLWLWCQTNKNRMYAHHFHATYVTCRGWMCVVHIHRYIDHDASLSPKIHWVYIHLHWRCILMLLPSSQAMLCL